MFVFLGPAGDPAGVLRVFVNGTRLPSGDVCSQDLVDSVKRNLSIVLECVAQQIPGGDNNGDYNVTLLANRVVLESVILPKNLRSITISHTITLEEVHLISSSFQCVSISNNIEACRPNFDCALGEAKLIDGKENIS